MAVYGTRNALIVELSKHTNQPVEYFQGFNNDDLVGKGAVVAFLRKAAIRDDAALKNMTDGDQRNTMVVENHNHTGTPTPQLQGMSNQDLVKMGLEWFAKSNFRFGDKVFIQNKDRKSV